MQRARALYRRPRRARRRDDSANRGGRRGAWSPLRTRICPRSPIALAALLPDAPLVHPARGSQPAASSSRFAKVTPSARSRTPTSCSKKRSRLRGKSTPICSPMRPIAYYEGSRARGRNGRPMAARRPPAVRRDLRLDRSQALIVRYAKIGGAFGGREDLVVQPLAALAAWKLKRPVSIVWNREESIVRPPQAASVSHHRALGRQTRRHDRRSADAQRRRRRRVCIDERRSHQGRSDFRPGTLSRAQRRDRRVSLRTPTMCPAARFADSAPRRRIGRPNR